MRAHEPAVAAAAGWQARLELRFERRDESTLMAHCRHHGPLRVQKPLHPEGCGICHAIVLHPPAGIAGGDELDIRVGVADGAHALLTTPGAAKWYRSAGAEATQALTLDVGPGGVLEWLPQESIVFDGALAHMESEVNLAADAAYVGLEVLCLGRRASGERFGNGTLRLATRISRCGRPLWLERGRLDGGGALLDSPVGLSGFSVCGTLLATGATGSELLAALRAIVPREAEVLTGITALPDLLVARYLGHSSEAAREWLGALWSMLRPALLGVAATTPRIWNT